MADYQKRKDEAMQEIEKQSSAYTEKRNQANTQYIQDTNAAYDSSGKAYSEKVQSEIGALPQKYRPQYDANAVQELVNRRQVAEAMANYGLTDSGLNRSQQTAISLQRGNADYNTRQQQAEEQRTMEQSIRDYLANVEFQKAAAAAQANLQAQNDIMNTYNSLFTSGMQNAAKAYGADLEAETAAARLAEEKQQAAAKLAEQQRQFNVEQAYKSNQQNMNAALQAAEYLAKAGASDAVLRQFLIDSGIYGGTADAGNNGETGQQQSSGQVNAANTALEDAARGVLNLAGVVGKAAGMTAGEIARPKSTIKMTADAVKAGIQSYIANARPQGQARTDYIKNQITTLYNAGTIDDAAVRELSEYYGLTK